MDRTEAELIAAVLRGDAASFEPLVQKYSPRVFATARRYARRESEVEDIVQEVWVKAYQKLADGKIGVGNPGAAVLVETITVGVGVAAVPAWTSNEPTSMRPLNTRTKGQPR